MRLGSNRGLLDPNDQPEPVRLNSLMSNFADGAGEFMGDVLGNVKNGIMDFITPSAELQAQRDAEKEAIKIKRLTPNEFGVTPQAWMYNTERSDSDNVLTRLVENFLPNMGDMYTGTSDMIRNPQPTSEAVGNLVAGGVLNLSGGLLDDSIGVEQREMANDFGNAIAENFGSWEAFSNMLIDNPVDALTAMVGIGMTATQLTKLAKNPAIQESVRTTLTSVDPMQVLRNQGLMGKMLADSFEMPFVGWHGSDRRFTRFDNKYLMTGEGNNVKGAGFYIGGRGSTSKQYFGQLDKDGNYDTTNFDMFETEVATRRMLATTENNPLVAEMWKDVLDNTATPTEVSKNLLQKYATHEDLPKLKAGIKEFRELWADQEFSLYKVNVPDSKAATFMNDAKGVYDQPEAVKKLLRKDNGAYMDLVESYKPLAIKQKEIEGLLQNKDISQPDSLDLKLELKNITDEQALITNKIDELGDFPHPDKGEDIYNFFVDREATLNPTSDMVGRNLATSQYLHKNGVMGRRWADDLGEKLPEMYDSENYLVFDESTARIFERNETPVGEVAVGSSLLLPTGEINTGYAGSPQRVGDVKAMKDGDLSQFNNELVGNNLWKRKIISFFDQEGKPFIASAGDTTRAGQLLTKIDGKLLQQPVEMMGGQDYMYLPSSVRDHLVWASAKEPIEALVKKAQQIYKETGVEPIFIPYRMKPTGMDYSKQIADSMIQSALPRLNKFQIEELNDTIRREAFVKPKDKPKKLIGKDFEGIDIENPLNDSVSGDLRKEIIRIMDRDYRQNGGLKIKGTNLEGMPSLAQIRVANADPAQLDVSPLTFQNAGLLDMDNLHRKQSHHETYTDAIGGDLLGTFKEQNVNVLDFFDSKRRNKKGEVIGDYMGSDGLPMNSTNWTDSGYRKTTMQPVSGIITHKRLMALEKRLEETGGIL